MLITDSDSYSAIEMRHLRALGPSAGPARSPARRTSSAMRSRPSPSRSRPSRGSWACARRAAGRTAAGLADAAGPGAGATRRADAGPSRRGARRPARAGGRRGRHPAHRHVPVGRRPAAAGGGAAGSGPTCRPSGSGCSRTRTRRLLDAVVAGELDLAFGARSTISTRASSRSSWWATLGAAGARDRSWSPTSRCRPAELDGLR